MRVNQNTLRFLCSIILFWTFNLIFAATYIVTTTADNPGGIDPSANAGTGTLRQAIVDANANAGADIIQFNLPGPTYVISPLAQLPIINDLIGGVLIDGFTQGTATPGANPPLTANLIVEIDGSLAGPSHGFYIISSSNTIRGLVIRDFEQDGIRIEANFPPNQFNMVYSNFIGTDIIGTADRGNGTNQAMFWGGVSILAPAPCAPLFVCAFNTVNQNLISGNYAQGVNISNCPEGDVRNNTVSNNFIGTDKTGVSPLGNDHDGVYIGEGAHDNTVNNNLIADNGFEGVGIVGLLLGGTIPINTYGNMILSNTIGLNINNSAMQNFGAGVSIGIYGSVGGASMQQLGFAPNNSVSNNTIASNGTDGVVIWEHPFNAINADRNLISQNSIYSNGGLGIDLDDDGITANDPSDPDSKANEDCNFPVISSGVISGSTTTITGTLDMPNPSTGVVEVFIANVDPLGNGEGQTYLGSATPNATGNWTLVTTTPVILTDVLTSTARDNQNNSSEFSANFSGLVLPLNLVSFEVNPRKNDIVLSWTSNEEIDFLGFQIERSMDASNFVKLDWVDGKGDENFNSYDFIDKNIQANQSYYYRLKMVDNDASFSYSPIKTATVKGSDNMLLFPNPTRGKVQLIIPDDTFTESAVIIYNLSGSLLRQYEINMSSIELDLSELGPGLYVLKIIGQRNMQSKKLIIE